MEKIEVKTPEGKIIPIDPILTEELLEEIKEEELEETKEEGLGNNAVATEPAYYSNIHVGYNE